MMTMKYGKRETTEIREQPSQGSIRTLGKKKITIIWEYRKRTASNKQSWEKNQQKSNSDGRENFAAEILPKRITLGLSRL